MLHQDIVAPSICNVPLTPKQCIPDAGSQGPILCGNYSKIKAKESQDSEPSSPILVLDSQSSRDIAETQLAVPEPQLPGCILFIATSLGM